MKAIIIAAGQGTRLRPHTATPGMVEVAGRPICIKPLRCFSE